MTILVLPIGEFDSDSVKNDFHALIHRLGPSTTDLIIADPVQDAVKAREFVLGSSKTKSELLVIIVLRGLSAETITAAVSASPVPCLVLPVQGRYALPSSALAVGALQNSPVPCELVYAPADNPESVQRINQVMRAAHVYTRIKTSRIGVIGGLFPNLVSCSYDPHLLGSRLGVSLIPISFEAVRGSIQSISRQTGVLEATRQEIIDSFKVKGTDENALDEGIKLHLALKQIAEEQGLDGFATECWSGFPGEFGLNPCMGFIEDAYTLGCEGDVMMCVSLLMTRYLTGKPAFVGDLYDLDMNGIMTLTHCGAPASLALDKNAVVVGRSRLAAERGFETLTCRPKLEAGAVTVFRLYGKGGDNLHLAVGELLDCGQSPLLSVRIRINANRWDFLEQCFGNHYLAATGDIRNELKLLCKWFGITVFET